MAASNGEQLLFPAGVPAYVPQQDEASEASDESRLVAEAKPFGRGFQCIRGTVHCQFSMWSHMVMCCDGAFTTNSMMGDRLEALEICPKGGFDENRIILYLHGGGHVMGTPWFNRSVSVGLAKTCNAKVWSLAYRLAPEHPFPAGLEDAYEAYRWLQRVYPRASIAIAGASAGGNLCFSLLVALAQRKEQQPIACIGISPWLKLGHNASESQDLAEGHKKFARQAIHAYCQEHASQDPLCSPLLASDEIVKCFPPVLIHTSEGEFLACDTKAMEKRCTDNGIVVEAKLYAGSEHVFQGKKNAPNTKDSIARMGAFLSGRWCGTGRPQEA